jgi:hypothetical protein
MSKIQDIIKDLTERTGIIFKAYNNEIWMPVSTKSIKTLKKKQELIVTLIQNKKVIFTGIGTLLKGDEQKLKIRVKPIEKKHDFDSFKFIYYESCKKQCTLELIRNKELEPTISSELRQSDIEKTLYKNIINLMDQEIEIKKKLKKEDNQTVKQKLIKDLDDNNELRSLKNKTLKKVINKRIQKEKEQSDLFTIGFQYGDIHDNIQAFVFKRM